MHNLIKHLKFLLSSTNQHGVHSPFVYNYVTKCLYSGQNYKGTKTTMVLLKSIRYFEIKNVWFPSNQKAVKNRIVTEFKSIEFKNDPYDLIYMDVSDFESKFSLLSNNIHNDTVLLLDSIYKDKENINLWKTIKKRKEVIVTIDMFYCGAIFFRQEQVKEHFKVRI